MRRFTKRGLIMASIGGTLAMGGLVSLGDPPVYPTNGNCDPGYHVETQHNVDMSFNAGYAGVGVTVTQAGNEVPVCLPNDLNFRVGPGAPSNGAGSSNQGQGGAVKGGSDQSGSNESLADMEKRLQNLLLPEAQKEFDAAKAEADEALLALERCEQEAAADSAKYPDGLEHSPGYTGRGAGVDRHARAIDPNPCQAEQKAWDEAYSKFKEALENLQTLQQELQALENSEGAGGSAPAPSPKQ